MMTKYETAAYGWASRNPLPVHADYRDELPDDMAQMILEGRFDDFAWECMEHEFRMQDDPQFWHYWHQECAEALGYEGWNDMSTAEQVAAEEARFLDTVDYWRTLCRNARPKVVATLLTMRGDQIYAPDLQYYDPEERHRARYIRNAFGFDGAPREVAGRLGVVYGGYDRECAVVIGTVDLWEILQARKIPKYITVGPRDSDQLFFYEHSNGCGNLGSMKIQNTRRFRVDLHIDGTRGYGIDSTYGFVGSMWTHELDVS